MSAATTPPTENALGTVRRKPNGRVLAVLWPSPPHPARWMVTDQWGSCGYETDEKVADWPVVGAVPFSPAAGVPLAPLADEADSKRGARTITLQRCCNGCGRELRDVTDAEIDAAIEGRRLPDVRHECPDCAPALADQAEAQTGGDV